LTEKEFKTSDIVDDVVQEILGSPLDEKRLKEKEIGKKHYKESLKAATRVLLRRGIDLEGHESEKERARRYIETGKKFILEHQLPFVKKELEKLIETSPDSPNLESYKKSLNQIVEIEKKFSNPLFNKIIDEDPRHLLLMASTRSKSKTFNGYGNVADFPISKDMQNAACSLLKATYLAKSIDEDTPRMRRFSKLSFFLSEHHSLKNLDEIDWENPKILPADQEAQLAYSKVSDFMKSLKSNLKENWGYDDEGRPQKNISWVGDDGQEIKISRIASRIKDAYSLMTKLAKGAKEQAEGVKDFVGVSFIVKDENEIFKLYQAITNSGMVTQDNLYQGSVIQTIFNSTEEVRPLARELAKNYSEINEDNFEQFAEAIFRKITPDTQKKNGDSAGKHRKFQFKINISQRIIRDADAGRVILPGMEMPEKLKISNETLPVEIRISTEKIWQEAEEIGRSSHSAYKLRQNLKAMEREFKGMFEFDGDNGEMAKDHDIVYAATA